MVRYAGIPIIAVTLAGCFYPPQQTRVPDSRTHLILYLPYYKVWDAVHQVIVKNDYRIITENPDEGTIEAQAAPQFHAGRCRLRQIKECRQQIQRGARA